MKPVLKLYIGKYVMVFDWKLWNKNGGDSKTDSFLRLATIVKINDINKTVDVKFDHDDRISKGHFSELIQEVT